MALTAENLHAHVETANAAYHRLVLLVGADSASNSAAIAALASERNYPLVNVNLALSHRMLELTKVQRAR
jgi:hypothetical protein